MSDSLHPDADMVLGELDRLAKSAAFSRSGNLFGFLRFVVEETLAGRGDSLKELVVGDTLYSGADPYDPRIDSTVRVEARRLRRKLASHYAGPGRLDPIIIDLPVGTYRPAFAVNEAKAGEGQGAFAAAATPAIDLAIMPFRAFGPDACNERFADGLTDELIFALEHRSRLRLAPRLMVFQYKNRTYSLSDAARDLGATAMLHGTLRREGARSRVTVELSNPRGFVTWSTRVDGEDDEPLQMQERFAGEIVTRMPPWLLSEASPAASTTV